MAATKATFRVPFLVITSLTALAGCGAGGGGIQRTGSGDEVGRTYYIDGAGNWGFGVSEVKAGLQASGYRGHVVNYRWSPTFNPALDQTVGRPVAKLKGRDLGRQITAYLRKYPQNEVNIIALSAGTGVAVWACEAVEPPAKVHSLVMLGSSLSASYDMRAALANISGGVWVYHSPNDQILLGPVATLGTIDGKIGSAPAGLVGLRASSPLIHNVPWRPAYERYGWTGAHTDATSTPFVKAYLSRHVVSTTAAADATATTAVSSELAAGGQPR